MKFRIAICAAIAAFLLTGCDAFRFLAGRPVSSEIDAMRERIEARNAEIESAREAARLDSIAAAKAVEDSLAVMAEIRADKSLLTRKATGGLSVQGEAKTYYIIVGSFKDRANAEGLEAKIRESGFPVGLVSFRNGYTAVGVCPTNSLIEAYQCMRRIADEKFCPENAWILINGQDI